MKIWRQEDWTDVRNATEVDWNKAGSKAAATECNAENLVQTSKESDQESESRIPQISDEMKKAREKAVYYLQFSGKTENELRKKLAEQEFSPASVNYAIDFVKKYRYLDDEDYARRFVEKNGNKKSRKQITYELTQKGISREILELIFEDMDVDEETQIMKILEKRNYPGEDAGRDEKQKISAYLARKGFSYDAIASALFQYARKSND